MDNTPKKLTPQITLALPRVAPGTVRDPVPCARLLEELPFCPYKESGEHTLIERLILGDHNKLALENDYDSPNQTSRYDVLKGMAGFATKELQSKVRQCRSWTMPDGPINWRFQPTPVPSGVLYITSGRAAWFGEKGITSPIIIWCIANGHSCDILTDDEEYQAYHQAIQTNLANLAWEVGDFAGKYNIQLLPTYATWLAQVTALIHVTSPIDKGGNDMKQLPRGFGFNRYMGMEWVRARFQQICATVDDNTFCFTNQFTRPALDWLFGANNMTQKANQLGGNGWLAVAFSPCTLATSDRRSTDLLYADRFGTPAYNGSGVARNTKSSPRIIQQLTVWNAATYRGLPSTCNYDPFLITGKEDVDFFRHLLADNATKDLLFLDNNLHLQKCGSSGTANQAKEKKISECLAKQIECLCPCFARAVKQQDVATLRAIEARFYGNGKNAPAKIELPELLKRINMALEQLLVPGLDL